MSKNKEKLDQMAQLNEELQKIRQESLAASRRGDFRTVARLTGETARLNRLILAGEGGPVPSLFHLGEKLFSGDTDEARHPAAPMHRELAVA